MGGAFEQGSPVQRQVVFLSEGEREGIADLFQPSYIGTYFQKLLGSGTVNDGAVQSGVVCTGGNRLAHGDIRDQRIG